MVDVAQIELVTANRNYVVLTVGKECSTHAARSFSRRVDALTPMLQINRSCMVT